ncbi:serine/threonine protein kinase [Pontimonas sp.]|nr:serine/threonine-protein kinase [Pontimonas sp.]MDA8887293.1 serine/threonine protein kinase [Pontimonas sp.]
MDPLVESDPRQLGPYKIIARLGSGGMGVVFLGSRGSQRVAVKVMRSSFLDSPTLKTRFEREIATLKKINSPFVAKYLDSDIEGNLVWHAVEFVNGPTLKEKIENDGPLDEENWWALYSQMREALKDVHRVAVVHRDLKPANIILSETGVKLIDFGISQDSDATSLTSTGMVAGSPAWLSPEQLEGTDVGPGSDLFSTGSILVYAALGRSPWGSETTMTLPVAYKKILSLDFDFDGLPSAYKDAVSPLLLEKASERSFLDRSLTGKVRDQDPLDEPEKSLANEEHGAPDPIAPEASTASRPNVRVKVKVAAGLVSAVVLGVAALLIFSTGPSSISRVLDNGNELATVSKPQSTPVFAGGLWEIHWRSGETYGLGPKTLFTDYYTAFANDVILIREDCGYGPEGGFQENEQVMVKYDSGWVSVSEPTLRDGACPEGQPLRTYTADLGELTDLVPPNECVPIRFTNTADRGAPDLYEEWCVSFPQSASQLEVTE